jgi:hypothetical protein
LAQILANFDLNEHIKLMISHEIVTIQVFNQHEPKAEGGIVNTVFSLFREKKLPAHVKLLVALKQDIKNGKFEQPQSPFHRATLT